MALGASPRFLPHQPGASAQRLIPRLSCDKALGLFSLLPCLGLFLATPAPVLGSMGLKKRKQNPAVKGSVHAWIGIVMGGIFTLVWGVAWIVMIIRIIAA